MSQKDKIATVFGGTGFVGRQIVRALAAMGVTVKVATRVPERAYFLKTCGAVGQVVPVSCDYRDSESMARAVKGSDFVVNCIGILYEKGKSSKFSFAHVEMPKLIAKACAENGVKRFVHISALGCENASSRYGKTKFEGEKAVLSNFPQAVILRPSVIFGEGDSFFTMFAELSRFTPVLPLIGGGKTKFQPVYVADVAQATINALTCAPESVEGRVFELGGPDILDFRGIYEKLFLYTGRRRILMTIPFGLAKVEGWFLGMLPKPLLTMDQVDSLKSDCVVNTVSRGFEALGIVPKSLDLILPSYLETYRSGGHFAKERQG